MRTLLPLAALAAVAAAVAAVAGRGETASAASAASCAKADLNLVTDGQLTVGTDNPAYPPWFGGGTKNGSTWKINDPSTGQGFESAVTYAVAAKLGFSRSEVEWAYVPFNRSFAPGKKSFDFDINQISYTPARAKVVSFGASYYNVNQSVVGLKGKPIASARTRAALKRFKLGAQLGTTSYQYIVKN